jgi:hypothetical protein
VVGVDGGPDGPVDVSKMLVVMVVEHVTVLPPPFSEPLHWSTVTGNAALVVPDAVQAMNPPPPVPDPLHCVTTGEPWPLGRHAVMLVPPPPPDPLHWSRVKAVAAAGEGPLMLLTMLTEHVVVLPPTLSDALHWCTALMTSVELTVSPVHPSRVQVRRYTTAEPPPLASMLLTIETEQLTERGAPSGPAACPLHCENDTVDADAGDSVACTRAAPSPSAASAATPTNARTRASRDADARLVDAWRAGDAVMERSLRWER